MTELLLREKKPLFEGSNWDFGQLRKVYEAIEDIALGELGLDVYPNQVEVITSEQMLDAYASVGLPLMYKHWSFGKRFAHHETMYRKGLAGLAYEVLQKGTGTEHPTATSNVKVMRMQ